MAWLGRHGVSGANSWIRPSQSNDVGKEIIAYASEVNADLIVMGGDTAIRRCGKRCWVASAAPSWKSCPIPVVMAH